MKKTIKALKKIVFCYYFKQIVSLEGIEIYKLKRKTNFPIFVIFSFLSEKSMDEISMTKKRFSKVVRSKKNQTAFALVKGKKNLYAAKSSSPGKIFTQPLSGNDFSYKKNCIIFVNKE